MISQRSKTSLDAIVVNALEDACSNCAVSNVDESEISASKSIMLTVSSYDFRMTVLLHANLDDAVRRHFAGSLAANAGAATDDACLDAICERANVFCGSLNRALAHQYPHVGMSTPNVLDGKCITHVGELHAEHIRHFKIDFAGAFMMWASLCICAFAEMDVDIADVHDQEHNGELEMF